MFLESYITYSTKECHNASKYLEDYTFGDGIFSVYRIISPVLLTKSTLIPINICAVIAFMCCTL